MEVLCAADSDLCYDLYYCELHCQGLKQYFSQLFQTLFGNGEVIKFDTINKEDASGASSEETLFDPMNLTDRL